MKIIEIWKKEKLRLNQVAIEREGLSPDIYDFRDKEARDSFLRDMDVMMECAIIYLGDDSMCLQNHRWENIWVYWK